MDIGALWKVPRWQEWLEKLKRDKAKPVPAEKKEEKRIPLESLAPLILEGDKYDEYATYWDALEQAMDKDSVCNIALSGEYSTGKSTIMETFLNSRVKTGLLGEKQREKGVIRLSLGNFSKELEDNGLDLVEQKILNQMIWQLDAGAVNGSGIYTKQHFRDRMRRLLSILLVIVVVAVLYFVVIPKVPYFNFVRGAFWYKAIYRRWVKLGVFLAAVFGAGYLLWKLVRLIPMNFLPNKFSVEYKDAAVSAERSGTGNSPTLFDIYMDEIVYLLKKRKVNMVVIEDLDRYDNLRIFELLREINFSLNLTSKKKVKFFYLIKESMFGNQGEKRTKFFDLIIPVVSPVSKENSWEVLRELCHVSSIEMTAQGGEDNYLIDVSQEELLSNLCGMYLRDYRMIKNIANEFHILVNQLKLRDEDAKILPERITRLLAMLIYKQIFPEDYAALQQGRGYMYSCIFALNDIEADWKRQAFEENIDNYENYKVVDLGSTITEAIDKSMLSEEEREAKGLTNYDYMVLPMERSYYQEVKKHQDFGMFCYMIDEELISEKDYFLYLSSGDMVSHENALIMKCFRQIVEGNANGFMRFYTELSDTIIGRLLAKLQMKHYSIPVLANRSIIIFMLKQYMNDGTRGENSWYKKLLLLAKQCTDEQRYSIFIDLMDDEWEKLINTTLNHRCELWAGVAWDDELEMWREMNGNYITIDFLIAAIRSEDGKRRIIQHSKIEHSGKLNEEWQLFKLYVERHLTQLRAHRLYDDRVERVLSRIVF